MQSRFKKWIYLPIISGAVIFGAASSAWATAQMTCTSHRNAPVFPGGSGQWRMTAEVTSGKTLRNVILVNMYRKQMGATSPRVGMDQRYLDLRVFRLESDKSCDYRLILPKSFSYIRTFDAEIEMACENNYHANATLACSRHD